MLYKNAQLDLLNKYSTSYKRIKIKNIKLHVTNNKIHEDQNLINSLLSVNLLLSCFKAKTLFNKKNNSAFNIKKNTPRAVIATLNKLNIKNFMLIFMFLILPQIYYRKSLKINIAKDKFTINIGIKNVNVFSNICKELNFFKDTGMSIEILLKESLHKPPKQIKSTNNNK
jgi:ribosomal protein L5